MVEVGGAVVLTYIQVCVQSHTVVKLEFEFLHAKSILYIYSSISMFFQLCPNGWSIDSFESDSQLLDGKR